MPVMMIWIVFSVLAVAAALSVLVPLSRSGREQRETAAYDVEVYKAQLGEVDRDLDRGLISEEAAEAAGREPAWRARDRRISKNCDVVVRVDGVSFYGVSLPAG